jgi:hypothetical protein
MFQTLVANTLNITLDEIYDRRTRLHGQNEILYEQLAIVEKGAKPLRQKWQPKVEKTLSGGKRHRPNTTDIRPDDSVGKDEATALLPAQTPPPPEAPAETTPTKSPSVPSQKINPLSYDPERSRKELLEELVAFKLRRTGNAEGISVTKFWMRALGLLDDPVTVSDSGDEQEDAAETASNDEGGGDDDMPQFSVPAYAKATEATFPRQPRKARRTYRPEQVDFDFMKGWMDLREDPIESTDFKEDDVSTLKNYRANKIPLSDFFSSDLDFKSSY